MNCLYSLWFNLIIYIKPSKVLSLSRYPSCSSSLATILIVVEARSKCFEYSIKPGNHLIAVLTDDYVHLCLILNLLFLIF